MTKTRNKTMNRNWSLVLVGSLYILLGVALIIIAVLNIHQFGWWSVLIGFAGTTPVAASITAIVKNEPSWILLDLIIPG